MNVISVDRPHSTGFNKRTVLVFTHDSCAFGCWCLLCESAVILTISRLEKPNHSLVTSTIEQIVITWLQTGVVTKRHCVFDIVSEIRHEHFFSKSDVQALVIDHTPNAHLRIRRPSDVILRLQSDAKLSHIVATEGQSVTWSEHLDPKITTVSQGKRSYRFGCWWVQTSVTSNRFGLTSAFCTVISH